MLQGSAGVFKKVKDCTGIWNLYWVFSNYNQLLPYFNSNQTC